MREDIQQPNQYLISLVPQMLERLRLSNRATRNTCLLYTSDAADE